MPVFLKVRKIASHDLCTREWYVEAYFIGPVKYQVSVALCITEAEYYAMYESCMKTLWIRLFLAKTGVENSIHTKYLLDNSYAQE